MACRYALVHSTDCVINGALVQLAALRHSLNNSSMSRTKFSLAQLLVLITMVAVGLGLAITHNELRKTRIEVDVIKRKYGELNVADPDYLHVHEITTAGSESLHWGWEVHLPPSKQWRLGAAIGGQIPTKGIPSNSRDTRGGPFLSISGDSASDISIVTVVISKLPEGGLLLTLKSTPIEDAPSQASIRLSYEHLPDDKMSWLFEGAGLTNRLAGKYQTEIHATDGQLILLRHRKGISTGTRTTQDPQPTSGLVVWIEQFPPQ